MDVKTQITFYPSFSIFKIIENNLKKISPPILN